MPTKQTRGGLLVRAMADGSGEDENGDKERAAAEEAARWQQMALRMQQQRAGASSSASQPPPAAQPSSDAKASLGITDLAGLEGKAMIVFSSPI